MSADRSAAQGHVPFVGGIPQGLGEPASPPLGLLSLWRDIHDRHWMLHAFRRMVHFYAGRGRRHFYVTRYESWDHPNLWHPEFRRVWRVL